MHSRIATKVFEIYFTLTNFKREILYKVIVTVNFLMKKLTSEIAK